MEFYNMTCSWFRVLNHLFICLAILTHGLSAQSASEDIALSRVWYNFLRSPSAQTAVSLYNALPASRERGHEHILYKRQLKTHVSIYEHLGLITGVAMSGDRAFTRLAFRLYTISDADFTETLDQALGSLIDSHPRLFLEELQNHRLLLKGHLGGLLCNLGDKYVDRSDEQIKVLKERRRKLLSVAGPNLSSLRDECLVRINDEIQLL